MRNEISIPFFFIFLLLLIILFPFIFIGVISAAFQNLGFSPLIALFLLLSSLIGSLVNIPIKKVKSWKEVRIGFHPMKELKETTIAVNVGGCIIPLIISIILIARFIKMYWIIMISTTIMTISCYKLSKIIPGRGIVLPFFFPPLIASIVAISFAHFGHPSAIAFISGVLGVLIGADLLNINKIGNLGSSVVSIGGAGTFDGIFLTGIISTLLVAIGS